MIVSERVLSDPEVGNLVELWHRHPRYNSVTGVRPEPQRTAKTKGKAIAARSVAVTEGRRFAPRLPVRIDSSMNYQRHRDRVSQGHADPYPLARTGYFRAVYATPTVVRAPLVEQFFSHGGLIEAAQAVFDRKVIVPAAAYANLLLPGQELGVHTDVPEFFGASRRELPSWLLVVMHHSGLFDAIRIPIATAVLYVAGCDGGMLDYYPDGIDGRALSAAPQPGSAAVMDADTVFHRINPVGGPDARPPRSRPGLHLVGVDQQVWELRERSPVGEIAPVGQYSSDVMRYSLSWKAFCFRDDDEREAWRRGDWPMLSLNEIFPTLLTELAARGRLPDGIDHLTDDELGLLMIDEFVRFPPA